MYLSQVLQCFDRIGRTILHVTQTWSASPLCNASSYERLYISSAVFSAINNFTSSDFVSISDERSSRKLLLLLLLLFDDERETYPGFDRNVINQLSIVAPRNERNVILTAAFYWLYIMFITIIKKDIKNILYMKYI